MKRHVAFLSLLVLPVIAIAFSGCASYDLEVRNNSDEVVDIYVDEFYEGSLAPNNYLIIRSLSYGDHYIEAYDLNKNLVAEDDIYLDGDNRWVLYNTYSHFY